MRNFIFGCAAIVAIASAELGGAQGRLKLNGTVQQFEFSGGERELVLFATSAGNLTETLTLNAYGPGGMKVLVHARKLSRQRRGRPGPWYNVSTQTEVEVMERRRVCQPIGVSVDEEPTDDEIDPSEYPSMESPICDLFSAEDKAAIEEQLESTFGGDWGPGNVCAYIVAMSNDPDLGGKDQWCSLYDWHLLLGLGIDCFPDTGFARYGAATYRRQVLSALVRRDACGTPRDRYEMRVTLRFPRSDTPFTVSLSARTKTHSGGKEASIKPVSEGRYAPRPLVLMSWLGTTCGNKISAVKWRGDKPRSVVDLSIYSFLAYKNLILALATVDSALSGGSGTFELHDGSSAYGVCMRMERTRQRVNGYPG